MPGKGSDLKFFIGGTALWAPAMYFLGRLVYIHFLAHNVANWLVSLWFILFLTLVWFFMCVKPLLGRKAGKGQGPAAG